MRPRPVRIVQKCMVICTRDKVIKIYTKKWKLARGRGTIRRGPGKECDTGEMLWLERKRRRRGGPDDDILVDRLEIRRPYTTYPQGVLSMFHHALDGS